MVETLISEETATRHVDACFHSVYVNTQKNNFFRVGMFRLAKKKKRKIHVKPYSKASINVLCSLLGSPHIFSIVGVDPFIGGLCNRCEVAYSFLF